MVIKEDDSWWFRDPMFGTQVGPYDTKQEAEDDLRGVTRFYKQETEFQPPRK